MKILIDTREQLPYRFERYEVEVIPATLPAGDYSLPGFEDLVSIERKSLDDLIGCLMGDNRARFERELQKGKHYDVFAVVVEGSLDDILRQRYRSRMNFNAVIQSVAVFSIRYLVPFVWCGCRECGELMAFSLLSKYAYEIDRRFERLQTTSRASTSEKTNVVKRL